MTKKKRNLVEDGEKDYQEWRAKLRATPGYQQIYEEEAAKSELWLQLVEARQTAGLTQAEVAKRIGITQSQVARLEKRGYEDYTLNSLRRYIQALGDEFVLEVKVRHRSKEERPFARVAVSR